MTPEQIETVNGILSRMKSDALARREASRIWKEMTPYRGHSKKRCLEIAEQKERIAKTVEARISALESLLAEWEQLLNTLQEIRELKSDYTNPEAYYGEIQKIASSAIDAAMKGEE